MNDSRRPSKWQDDAVQAADTHCGRKTEKKRQAPRHECAEKHEDTINEVKKGLQGCPKRASSSWGGTRQFLGWSPFKVSHPSQLQV